MIQVRLVAIGFMLLAVAVLPACKSTGTLANPPLGPKAIKHMYLSENPGPGAGSVAVYDVPVTSASTPAQTVAALGAVGELYVDKTGRLFAPIQAGSERVVDVFKSPVISSSTPAFTLTTTDVGVEDVAENSAGSVFVSANVNNSCCIDVFNGPVNGTTAAPSFTMNSNGVVVDGLGDPVGLAFDNTGTNLYVSSINSTLAFTAPIGSSSTPAANVANISIPDGVAVDATDRVFVANATVDGTVAVYDQPFTSSSVPAFNIADPLGAVDVRGIAFDGSGDLWAVDAAGKVWEVTSPITSSSVATVVLSGTNAEGIAFGP